MEAPVLAWFPVDYRTSSYPSTKDEQLHGVV